MVPLYSVFFILHSLFNEAFLQVRHPMYYSTYSMHDYMLHPYLWPFFMIGTHYDLRVTTQLWKFSSHNSHWSQRGESSRTMDLNGNSIV